jgi:8-amino-7-oxononanoate synthase
VGCFRPPSVPKGRACLRITARASITDIELAVLSEALAVVAAETDHVTSGPTAGEHKEGT